MDESRVSIGGDLRADMFSMGALDEIETYCAAVVAAPLGTIAPWLTYECPECEDSFSATDSYSAFAAEHATIGSFVIVGCEGAWVVNPNAVGIPTENWQDWTDE